MSIRTRVMVGTLGLAVIGFVGTLGAAEDEILIVRDGSVEVYVNNSHFKAKQDGKQKWSKKGDTVEVLMYTPSEEQRKTQGFPDPCISGKGEAAVKFKSVALLIVGTVDGKNVDVPVNVVNEGFFGKLTFGVPEQWQFTFKKYKHLLTDGTEERPAKIQQVTVTPDTGPMKLYPEQRSSEVRFCVIFRDN